MPHDEFLIILPVRNGGTMVAAAIDGILSQRHTAWRLMVLENASTDDTLDVVGRYAAADDRIEVRPAPHPLSIYENWHRGYDLLEEDWVGPNRLVTFLGHDDLFQPEFLTDMALLAAANPDATLYQTLFDLIDENDGRLRPCRPVPDRESWTSMLASMLWNLRDSFGTGYVFRAKDYLAVGGIPDLPMLLFSDFVVFVRLARLGYKVSTLESRFSYRRHSSSTSGTPSKAKHAAHLNSMYAFVSIIQNEFSDFAATDMGRAGIAALLARELSLLTVPVIRATFDSTERDRLSELLRLYDAVANGVPASTLVGQPYRPARLFVAIRRFNVAQEYLRYRFWNRFQRK